VLQPFALLLVAAALDDAAALYRKTDYTAALRALGTPSVPAELELAARCHYGLGELKQAAVLLEQAIAREPGRASLHHWLGRVMGRRAETASVFSAPGLASKARQHFEKAVQLDPRRGEALSDLFEYYLQAPGFLGGGRDKAASLLDRIGAVDPAEREFALFRLAEDRKEWDGAELHLRRAIELAPKQVGRRVDLARFLARRGRIPESETVFEEAAALDPNHPALLYGRAETYVEGRRKPAEARALLERYLKLDLTPDDPPRSDARKLLAKP